MNKLVKNFFLFLLGITCITTSEKLDDDLIVQLKEGKIRGHILKSENGNDFYSFQEIPYAAPPIGPNRFQLPKKVQPWDGVLNTTKNTKVCYQVPNAWASLESSEDCLYLNVYTPQKPGSDLEQLPVLLWIHGGGYIIGTGSIDMYGPKYIMDYGIVVVTLNYRLGTFGFITTDDNVIPANMGLKDQKLAIEWVSENIHLFGGDSAKITLAGESAGSMSVNFHLLGQTTGEKELFRAAIMQSGSALSGVMQYNPREEAFQCGRNLNPNFKSNKSSDLLELLQNDSAASILQACRELGCVYIEKEGDYCYEPLQSLMDRNFSKIPILMGFNSEEWLRVVLGLNVNDRLALDNDPALIVPSLINMSPENRTIAGKLLKKLYTNSTFENDPAAFTKLNSDNIMTTPISKHVELISPVVPTYFYQFSYDGLLGQGPSNSFPGAEGVTHGEDLMYMWDQAGSNSDLSKFSEIDVLTLRRFLKMWTNFVKYLNPTPENDPLLNNFIWPPSDSENLRYFNFNDTLEVKEYPRKFKDVEAILNKYMEPPFNFYGANVDAWKLIFPD